MTELLKKFQASWSINKYWVMARNQNAYNEIRQLAKNNQWDEAKQARYQEILLNLATVTPTTKTLRVTYQHLWGYFKKIASPEEKKAYQALLAKNLAGNFAAEVFFQQLITKYQEPYLLKIRWLTD